MIVTNTVNMLGGLNGLETICPAIVILGLMALSPLIHSNGWTTIILANFSLLQCITAKSLWATQDLSP